jgi:hypothetical protein
MLDTAECEADKVELLARDAELPKWEADEEEWVGEAELLAREADEELCALEDELTCETDTDTEDECAEEDVAREAELLECTADEELVREVDADNDAELLARKAELLGCAADDELCAGRRAGARSQCRIKEEASSCLRANGTARPRGRRRQ